MRLIVAIIQPDKLDEVHQALIDAEIFRITVSRVTGHGRQEDQDARRGGPRRPFPRAALRNPLESPADEERPTGHGKVEPALGKQLAGDPDVLLDVRKMRWIGSKAPISTPSGSASADASRNASPMRRDETRIAVPRSWSTNSCSVRGSTCESRPAARSSVWVTRYQPGFRMPIFTVACAASAHWRVTSGSTCAGTARGPG
jgi:hypothetical protein